ncbi:hypothetical protein A5819_003136 [Enterococcus sp. 7E2_DIV0204]|uniref:DUF6093 family protein n=1 Tax=unclassified Enterococcus TaxID=2608891 RepID=UPI000A35B67B|nr:MULTISPECIES: DUF6093 family protein [unclassified Enterococcus]OTN86302.1 hypothetical protein A5819_003136 [Enterococcus sp. 7E2_DIV0204]OTP48505.1 hypothetical protein A5884_003168 [Enterococcus sp. 7D2_DIV0200]
MNEAEILAMTYTDTCTIERYGDHEDPETGVTEQTYQAVSENLPCALSQSGLGSSGNLAVVENTGMVNVTYEEQKLFLMPTVDIRKGDRIQITQSTGQQHTSFAKKPFSYPSHLEVNLSGSEIDG